MSLPSQSEIVKVLLERKPESFAQGAGIAIESAGAAPLFQLLVAAVLSDERSNETVIRRVLDEFAERRWTSPENLAHSSTGERINALERADYFLFSRNEEYALRLGEAAEAVMYSYQNDLTNLRMISGEKAERERELLAAIPGMRERPVEIFCREVQLAWCEQFPFMTASARAAMKRLSFEDDPAALAELCAPLEFPRLVSALEDVDRSGNPFEVIERAGELQRAAP